MVLGKKNGASCIIWDDEWYLIVVDYFVKYPFMFQMHFTTVSVVIGCLTELFCVEGTAIEVFTDTGQTINSCEWN